jgi:hypothetical protein
MPRAIKIVADDIAREREQGGAANMEQAAERIASLYKLLAELAAIVHSQDARITALGG